MEAVESESMAVEASFLYKYEIEHARKNGTSWYRSKGRREAVSPYSTYLMSKKWSLVEEMNLHIMRFQQVTVVSHI